MFLLFSRSRCVIPREKCPFLIKIQHLFLKLCLAYWSERKRIFVCFMSRHHSYAQAATAVSNKIRKMIWIIWIFWWVCVSAGKRAQNKLPSRSFGKNMIETLTNNTALRRWPLSESIVNYSEFVDEIEYHISKFECDLHIFCWSHLLSTPGVLL